MRNIKILVAEDNPSLLGTLSKRLRDEGYYADTADNGEDALAFIHAGEYDVIILDILMPKMNGLEVLKKARSRNISTPVLLLTALGYLDDKVKGLDAGADDYLVKPFEFDELLARIRVLLRRRSDNKTNVLTAGDLVLDSLKRTVMCGGAPLDLSAKEYDMLEYLMRNKGSTLTRAQIAAHVWDYDYDFESNVVDVYIRYLRRKLEQCSDKKIIHTVRGMGYVLREE